MPLIQGTMPQHRAQCIQRSLNCDTVFFTRVEFIECIAVITRLLPEETVRQVPGHNKSVRAFLHCVTAPDRIEWLLKNLRMKHSIAPEFRPLLPTGSTSNESLHAEINNWFRQTQTMHQATLTLKLKIMRLSKLKSHNSAMYNPTLRQFPSNIVLVRSICQDVWTRTAWSRWCKCLDQENKPLHKASLTGVVKRSHQVKLVKHNVLQKRPAVRVIKRPCCKKRTAFTRKRNSRLLTQGVRNVKR